MWDKDCASKIHLLELDQIVYFTVPKYMRIVLLCFPDLFSIQVWMSKMSDGIKDAECHMNFCWLLKLGGMSVGCQMSSV